MGSIPFRRLWPLAAFSAPDPTRSFDLTSRPTGAKRRATGFSFSSRSIDRSIILIRFDSTRGFFERLDSHHGVAVWPMAIDGSIASMQCKLAIMPPRLFFSRGFIRVHGIGCEANDGLRSRSRPPPSFSFCSFRFLLFSSSSSFPFLAPGRGSLFGSSFVVLCLAPKFAACCSA